MKQVLATCFGEMLGTFILVFFGTAAVAAAVLFGALASVFQVAIIWGIGVTLAIFATRHLSCAHLNPAVSLGMVLAGRMRKSLLLPYWISQLLGAMLAGAVVLLLFHGPIAGLEQAQGIIRGAPQSVVTAQMFGEYFPNPGAAKPWFTMTITSAMLVEGITTFVLVTMIFLLTEGCNVGRPSEGASPIFIGGTVTALIAVTASLTQTGMNPARDFGPRLISYMAGWDQVAIPGPQSGFFWVYIAAPLLGGALAAAFFRLVISPLMIAKTAEPFLCSCQTEDVMKIDQITKPPDMP